jgi:uncharacterized membrane protein YbhN (UPF0104 family)
VSGALHGIGAVADRFADLDGRLIALAVLLHLSNHLLRSLAWRNVLRAAYPDAPLGLIGVATAYALGVALNAVLPARGGDAVKIAIVRARVAGSSVATITSTMSVVVLFDLAAATALVLAVCLTGSLPLTPQVPGMDPLVWGGAAVALAAVGAMLLRHRVRERLLNVWDQARQGGAILRTPTRYFTRVALVQAVAWLCRIGVVVCLLAAFGLQASPLVAAMVMILCGVSTLVPLTPGGAGTQQVMLAYALSQTATAAAVVSFSVGMQAGITAVNALLGLGAAMIAFRTLRPHAALRSAWQLARG